MAVALTARARAAPAVPNSAQRVTIAIHPVESCAPTARFVV